MTSPATGLQARQPIAIDLFCGLGGWTEGLLAEGYYVVGFDIERHEYGDEKYPAQLVLQDVMTIHGRQFKDVDLIVASPPCQEYSYMAMPWSVAKQKAREYRDGTRDVKNLTALFDACFRIQREACAAAGRHIPLVVENVRGAQPWVGRSRWNFGSYHLWGDVPALMPMGRGRKNSGGSWFAIAHNKVCGNNPDGRKSKDSGSWFYNHGAQKAESSANFRSGSMKRKRYQAQIAKIPFALSSHIAATYKPMQIAAHLPPKVPKMAPFSREMAPGVS